MPDVSGHEVEAVVDRGRGDLKVRVGKPAAFPSKSRLDLAEDTRDRDIVGKNGQGRQDPRIDVLQITPDGNGRARARRWPTGR